MLGAIVLNVVYAERHILNCNAECNKAACHYAECCIFIVMLRIVYAECHNFYCCADCYFAECHLC